VATSAKNVVAPAPDWYAIDPVAPPAKLVAVVAVVALVALVAVVALPLNAAVIVPAAKLPEASRATTLEAVFVVVASTANVRAAAPVNVPALVKYVPAVKAFATCVAVVAVVALPLKAAVTVPAVKFPDASRATIAEAVFADVALDVTVKLEAPA
jgi:hypothetical protein